MPNNFSINDLFAAARRADGTTKATHVVVRPMRPPQEPDVVRFAAGCINEMMRLANVKGKERLCATCDNKITRLDQLGGVIVTRFLNDNAMVRESAMTTCLCQRCAKKDDVTIVRESEKHYTKKPSEMFVTPVNHGGEQ